MQFQTLVETLYMLEQTSSRNGMTELLVELLKHTEAGDVCEVVYLVLGQLGPQYARVDFGLADKMVVRGLAQAYGVEVMVVTERYKQIGDLGLVAFQLASEREVVSTLTVKEVYTRLMNLAQATGVGSQERKVTLLAELLHLSQAAEAKYLVRMVLGKMRLGFSDKTILDALSVVTNGNKSSRAALDYVYQVAPDIGMIATKALTEGVEHLKETIQPQVGVPVIPALAQRLKTADEMITKMGKVVVEPKYDGVRTQIHVVNATVTTYARSLEETTAQFPEALRIPAQLKVESVIIDAEAIGFDPKTGALKPFQETITRKRKHGVDVASSEVPIKFFCFDLLFLNGESLIAKPLYERRKLLEAIVAPGEVLVVDPLIATDSAAEVRAFHAKQLAGGLEGAMVKKYDGEYQPGRTGWNWVKFKEAEEAEGKLTDTVDAVVMGYYRGKGKRSGFGIGAFLVGIRRRSDEATREFELVTVAKIGTGLSDEQWRELKRRADEHFSIEKPANYIVAEGLVPDVWADPVIVVEIAADELTKSPLHSSGWGLRFPRLVRFRDDKIAEEATTAEEIKAIGGIKTDGVDQ